jgi:3-demethoxyubiquinol 3-hydroxylase
MSLMNQPASSSADSRQYSLLDRLLGQFDQALRTVAGEPRAQRPNPAGATPSKELTTAERTQAAGLMRVNHAGEVAAQALYYGQALTTSSASTRAALLKSAQEEGDHLAWCSERIAELGSHTSYASPVWYVGSFAIGAAAGLSGDRLSLGFVAETERQVEQHLSSHLDRLPVNDERSRVIVTQMQSDEREHGRIALQGGGVQLPTLVRRLMRATARIMTSTAYWV